MSSGLVSLKSKLDKLDIVKLETTPVDLDKLINIVKIILLKRFDIMKKLKKLIILVLLILVIIKN